MAEKETTDKPASAEPNHEPNQEPSAESESSVQEYGGPKGKEPTRYGDWEKNGRCIDF